MKRVPIPIVVKLGVVFLALLLATATFLVVFFPDRMLGEARRWAERGGVSTAEVLATAVTPSVEFADYVEGSAAKLRVLLENVTERQGGGVTYAAVLRRDETVLAQTGGSSATPASRPPLQEATTTLIKEGILHVAVPIRTGVGDVAGHLVVGFSLADLEVARRDYRSTVLLVSVVLVVVGLGVSALLGFVIVRPIRQLTQVAAAIVARGDLAQTIDIRSRDEVGQLAESFSQMVVKLRSIPSTLNELVEGLLELTERLSQTAKTVSSGASVLRGHVASTSAAMREMLDSLTEVGKNIAELERNATRSARSNEQMSSVTGHVFDSVRAMVGSVESTNTAIEGMLGSIQATARSINQLDASLDATSNAMQEIAGAVSNVEARARDTAELSTQVARDSEYGVGAIRETLGGIGRIRASSETAVNVMSQLDGHVSAIDRIIGGISGITDQTNLLALNAAITAAQAGEHGRGFAVVAGEIKALAGSAATSTHEVGSLLEGIQSVSHNALAAVAEGQRHVQEGVVLGNQAHEALRKNLDSASRATLMVRSIAEAARGQSEATKRVTRSVVEIAEAVQRINSESARQAARSDELVRLTGQMRSMTERVRGSSEEQARGTELIAQSVAAIGDMVGRVSAAQSQQSNAAQRVLRTVESVERVANDQSEALESLDQALASLRERADNLREAVRQFVV